MLKGIFLAILLQYIQSLCLHVMQSVLDKSTTTAKLTDSKASISVASSRTEKERLANILNGQPCHIVKARIGRFTIHHGSFHTLKPGIYINDEIVNGYLRLLASIHGNCFIIGTFSLTAIINRAAPHIYCQRRC